MRVRITQLHKELKTTMIYVTHDQVEAMTMGERITVLNYGKIMQVDTPLNLYHRPANKFVAGFIGSPTMNLIEADLIEEDSKIYVKIADQKIPLNADKAAKVKSYIGKKVIFGIRPESISLGTESDIKGEVTVVEQMGNEEYIYFNMGMKQWTSRINVEGIDFSKKSGTCYFKFDTSKCHIFDIETEKNVSL